MRTLKFIYSEKATKFCEIFPLLLTTEHTVKSKGEISQNFAAFSEYMNFNVLQCICKHLLYYFYCFRERYQISVSLFTLSDLKYCLDKYIYVILKTCTLSTKHVEKLFWLNPNWHKGGNFPPPILFGSDFVN